MMRLVVSECRTMKRARRLIVRVLGVGVEVDGGAPVGGGSGGGVLGEGGVRADEGADEVSEADEEGDEADEGDGGTTVDEVSGGLEVVVVGPVLLAEPGAARGGAVEGAELNVLLEEEEGRGGEAAAVGEGIVDLGHEGLGLVVNDDDQGERDHEGGEADAGEGEGVAGGPEEGNEAEGNGDQHGREVEGKDPGVLAGVPAGVGVGGISADLVGVGETGGDGAGIAEGVAEVADLGPVEELGVELEQGDVVAVVEDNLGVELANLVVDDGTSAGGGSGGGLGGDGLVGAVGGGLCYFFFLRFFFFSFRFFFFL